ncbi:hypothetical protein M231_01996 [Tremella mesenterica]|uniref:Uncharacterized protein n=1 Tax=Tremella mesenterica TaxID=5217 RepID=A0A4Q1BRX2_TREME|nr:hypothetical protein M231_01996 [Tremella mesenterica]
MSRHSFTKALKKEAGELTDGVIDFVCDTGNIVTDRTGTVLEVTESLVDYVDGALTRVFSAISSPGSRSPRRSPKHSANSSDERSGRNSRRNSEDYFTSKRDSVHQETDQTGKETSTVRRPSERRGRNRQTTYLEPPSAPRSRYEKHSTVYSNSPSPGYTGGDEEDDYDDEEYEAIPSPEPAPYHHQRTHSRNDSRYLSISQLHKQISSRYRNTNGPRLQASSGTHGLTYQASGPGPSMEDERPDDWNSRGRFGMYDTTLESDRPQYASLSSDAYLGRQDSTESFVRTTPGYDPSVDGTPRETREEFEQRLRDFYPKSSGQSSNTEQTGETYGGYDAYGQHGYGG